MRTGGPSPTWARGRITPQPVARPEPVLPRRTRPGSRGTLFHSGRAAADDYLSAWRPVLEARPDALPVGSVHVVSYADVHEAFGFCECLQLGPALGIYEPNSLRTTLAWYRAGRLPAGSMVKLYFAGDYGLLATTPGVSFGLAPTQNGLLAYLDMLEGCDLP